MPTPRGTHSTIRRLSNLGVHIVPVRLRLAMSGPTAVLSALPVCCRGVGKVAGGDDAEAAVETVTLSDELKSLAAESLIQPGHDLTRLGTNEAGKELVVTGGEGAYLLTADGTKVLDGPGGIWNVQMGYGQMKIVDAVSEQMTTLPFNSPFATIAAPAAILAKEIAKKAPADLNHVFFVTGGSEANDTALQFIYYRNNYMGRPNKKIVLARERAYHGTTYMAHSLSMDTDNMESMNSMGEGNGELVSRLTCPDPLNRPEGMTPEEFTNHLVAELEDRIKTLGSDNIAAFIAEPVMGAGGCVVPPPGYIRKVWEVCQANDIAYISDEVVTGYGRLGAWFASEDVFGIQPDIITFAKGITSGYQPLGGCIISDRLLESVSGDDNEASRWQVGYTYSGHPCACAAGIANLELMEETNILGHVQDVGPAFQSSLKTLEGLPLVVETRGLGLMAGIELVDHTNGDSEDTDMEAVNTEQCKRISDKCLDAGAILRMQRNRAVLSPCLVITKAEALELVDIIRTAAVETYAELLDEGLLSA